MRFFLPFLFLLIAQFVNGQTKMQQEIIGKWKFVNKTGTTHKQIDSDSIANTPASDTFFNDDMLLDFRANESLGFELVDSAILLFVSYKTKDSILTIAEYTYHIVKLNKEELRIKAHDATYQYKRIAGKK